MTDRRAGKFEFDSVIGSDASIRIPPEILREIRGERVRVILTDENLARALSAAGVTEEEVRRMADRQMEPREHVLRFLLSEGSVPRYGRRLRRQRRA